MRQNMCRHRSRLPAFWWRWLRGCGDLVRAVKTNLRPYDLTRRQFLATTGLALAAALMLIPASAFGQGATGPSNPVPPPSPPPCAPVPAPALPTATEPPNAACAAISCAIVRCFGGGNCGSTGKGFPAPPAREVVGVRGFPAIPAPSPPGCRRPRHVLQFHDRRLPLTMCECSRDRR